MHIKIYAADLSLTHMESVLEPEDLGVSSFDNVTYTADVTGMYGEAYLWIHSSNTSGVEWQGVCADVLDDHLMTSVAPFTNMV